MNKQIDNISIKGVMWGEVKENRISFRFNGMPKDVHFTIAWNKGTGKTNLHATRNIGNDRNKPYIKILEFDKIFQQELAQLVPDVILGKIFQPISFRKLSRRKRKNIWLFFADELEKYMEAFHVAEELSLIWLKGSKSKKNRVIVPDIDQLAIAMVGTDGLKKIALNKMRRLKKDSFNSPSLRLGFIHTGKNMVPFISANGQCHIAKKGVGLDVLFHSFAEPEFARTLKKYIKEALLRIKNAQTRDETMPYSMPYALYLKEAN